MAMDTDGRTLFVANLDRNVSEEILYELFLQAGPIERVSKPGNESTYGFVTYKHQCSIDYAIELYKGTSLYKKEIMVKRKTDRRDTGRQYGYGEQSRFHDDKLAQNSLQGLWSNRQRMGPYGRDRDMNRRNYRDSNSRDRRDFGRNYQRERERFRDRRWH